jgi:hypothetical protein
MNVLSCSQVVFLEQTAVSAAWALLLQVWLSESSSGRSVVAVCGCCKATRQDGWCLAPAAVVALAARVSQILVLEVAGEMQQVQPPRLIQDSS